MCAIWIYWVPVSCFGASGLILKSDRVAGSDYKLQPVAHTKYYKAS